LIVWHAVWTRHGVEGRRPCCLSAVEFRPALPAPDKELAPHPAVQLRLLAHFRIVLLPFVSDSLLLSVRLSNARNGSTPLPCGRLSRTPWVVGTPPPPTGPLPRLGPWRPLRLPCSQGARGGSGVARTAFSPSALGTRQFPLRPAYRPGKLILSDEESLRPPPPTTGKE
jgi:hypothetical protein